MGMPLPGIRVAAVAKAGTPEEAISGASMAGIAETDEQGRFVLENIPPGRYIIAAGRLDRQTYHPGTQRPEDATVVTIAPGAVIVGINFVVGSASFGRASPLGVMFLAQLADVPVTVAGENGEKFPVSAGGKIVRVLLSSTTIPVAAAMPVDGNTISVPGPVTAEFRVSVVNLPEPYRVKSITYGATDITRGSFPLTPSNFYTTSASPGSVVGLSAGLVTSATVSPSTVSITLARSGSIPSTGGAIVSGQTGNLGRSNVLISGKPGVFFSDGTFEFRGVPAGRHLIAAAGGSLKPTAAVVVVGEQHVENLELKEIPFVPPGAYTEQNVLPVGSYPAGTVIPLVRVTGTILEELSRKPLTEGELIVKQGDLSGLYRLDAQGHVEPLYLLPGKYTLTLQAFGHSTTETEIDVTDKDIALELTTRRLY
jgi:hypothetical protein